MIWVVLVLYIGIGAMAAHIALQDEEASDLGDMAGLGFLGLAIIAFWPLFAVVLGLGYLLTKGERS